MKFQNLKLSTINEQKTCSHTLPSMINESILSKMVRSFMTHTFFVVPPSKSKLTSK